MNSWIAPGLGLFMLSMFGFVVLGRRLGRRFDAKGGSPQGIGVIDAAIFALLGLLVAFSFSGAEDRFDQRRKLIIEEANAIGTAYLRVDLLPESARPSIRREFRQYLESRLGFYRNIGDVATAKRYLAESRMLHRTIWNDAVAGAEQAPTTLPGIVLLPALNQMIDITTTRTAVLYFHPPMVILAMLVAIACVCAVLAGFDMRGGGKVSRLHATAFTAILALTIYVVIDLEFPRRGTIRVDATDEFLVDLRELIK